MNLKSPNATGPKNLVIIILETKDRGIIKIFTASKETTCLIRKLFLYSSVSRLIITLIFSGNIRFSKIKYLIK